MRKLILALVSVTAVAAIPAPVWGQVQAGAYLAFHDEVDLGIGGFVGIPVPEIYENVSFVGDFGYFFPDKHHNGVREWDYWEANADLMYKYPLEDARFTPWVMAGLNLAHSSWSDAGEGYVDSTGSDTDIGLNLGGGVTFGTGTTLPFAGVKFELGGGEGAVIFGGVSFLIGGEG
jgi:hypothetical protein